MNKADAQYKLLKDNFIRIAKNIYIYKTENRKLPNQGKINTDVDSLFNAYDDLITLIASNYETQNTEAKEFLIKSIENYFKPKLIQTLVAYNLTVDLPNEFEIINRNTLEQCEITENLNESNILPEQIQNLSNTSGENSAQTGQSEGENQLDANREQESSETEQNQIDQILIEPLIPNTTQANIQTNTMVQSISDFLAQTGSFLKQKYDGDPAKLEGFLNDVEMIVDIVEANNAPVKAFCLKFIKSKLEGRASECMPNEIATVKHITDALKKNIKAESSKVIEGKVTALKVKFGDLTKFSEEAEKLTEALRRSYISEGLTKDKAKEITIEKTIDMCRRSARNDIVKSVLSSTAYETPSEVIAKYITQVDLVRRENLERGSSKNFKTNKPFHKNNGHSHNDRRQNFNRDQQSYRNSYGKKQDKFYRGNKHTSDNARGKFNKNEHTIRFVAQPQPGTSRDSEQNTNSPRDESFFRIGNP